MATLYMVLLVIDIIVAIAFTFIVTIQSSKSEGLTGGGSSAAPSARSVPGFEDQISKVTLIFGVMFMGLTALLSVIAHRMK